MTSTIKALLFCNNLNDKSVRLFNQVRHLRIQRNNVKAKELSDIEGRLLKCIDLENVNMTK